MDRWIVIGFFFWSLISIIGGQNCRRVEISALECLSEVDQMEFSCSGEETIAIGHASLRQNNFNGCPNTAFDKCTIRNVESSVRNACDGRRSCALDLIPYRSGVVPCEAGVSGNYFLYVTYKCIPPASRQIEMNMCANAMWTGRVMNISSHASTTSIRCSCLVHYWPKAELHITTLEFNKRYTTQGLSGCDFFVLLEDLMISTQTRYVCNSGAVNFPCRTPTQTDYRDFELQQVQLHDELVANYLLQLRAANDVEFTVYCGDEDYVDGFRIRSTTPRPSTTIIPSILPTITTTTVIPSVLPPTPSTTTVIPSVLPPKKKKVPTATLR